MTAAHGTKNSYNQGCRCDDCRIANRDANAAWQRKIRARPVPGRVHGTVNGYTNYGCRCDGCRAAIRDHHREYEARLKAAPSIP